METEGLFTPESAGAARERFDQLGASAQVVVKESAKAMDLSPEAYRERVTSDVIATAREALFASMLEVHVADRPTFESWLADHPDYEVVERGNENVDNVVWHAVPFRETVVAATFQDERRAAIETLRRQAFGTVYRDLLEGD
jgi:hypothetical protein